MFITVDGIDGAGKSSLLDRAEEFLKSQQRNVLRVRDPGSTTAGEAIRGLLLDSDLQLHRRSEALLYMAARCQLVEERIRPARAAGTWILSDRYLLANVCYQSAGSSTSAAELWQLGRIATGGLAPDLTVLLDLPAEVAMQRIQRPADRMEKRGVAYMEAVRQAFLEQLPACGGQTCVLDAAQSPEKVWSDLEAVLRGLAG